VDIDNFKPYNDTWGHAAGDALLQHFAHLMIRVFREEDVVCRFGGEEFVIVLPNASWDLVGSSAEILRTESHQLHVHLDGQLLGGITVSAGLALAPSHGTTTETLLASADRALYAAKSGGRDRVAVPDRVVAA
jgi:diguanylate cyclase (GGDEF)-like protein